MDIWLTVSDQIEQASGQPFKIKSKQSISGGCINQAFKIASERQEYFVKLNHQSKLDMFEAEAAGLSEIIESDSVKAPHPLTCGIANDYSFLVLEFIILGGGSSASKLGEQLADMHKCTSGKFGWVMDNTIGSTPQINSSNDSWISFWRDQRIAYQLKLAEKKGARKKLLDSGNKLLADMDKFFQTYQPEASLLHGDLWGGNWSTNREQQPVIFDPAVYYGDRETDIAMTELFGGFGGSFYSAYQSVWPLDEGYSVRKELYNLYHILNHYNLFGGGYASQAEMMVDRLLSELV